MRIIFLTHSSNPDDKGDCDYAVLDVNTALLDLVRRRVELVRQALAQDPDVHEVHFWGSTARFYSSGLVHACEDAVAAAVGGKGARLIAACDWLNDLQDKGHAKLPHGVDLPAHEPERTECGKMIVGCMSRPQGPEFDIAWTARPKHSDTDVATSELLLDDLETYFRGAAPIAERQESP